MEKKHAFADVADTLVVMTSPAGVPENFDILRLCDSTSEEQDMILARCVNRYCTIADKGDFVPDNHIQVYNFGSDAHLEFKFWQFTTDRDSISNYTDVKDVAPYLDIPLRAAHYVYQGKGGIRSLEDLKIDPEIALPVTVVSLSDYLKKCHSLDRSGPQVHTVMGIGTNKGMLYFSDDGVGKECCRNYLQDIADRYFNSENRDLAELRECHVRANQSLINYAEETKAMFCLHNNSPISRKITCQDIEAEMYMNGLRCSIQMGPNLHDFENFITTFELGVSEKNKTICTLLQIHEVGISKDVVPPARHRAEFNTLLQPHGKVSEQAGDKATVENSVKLEISALAGRILREKYGIVVQDIHHPELNRRIDPPGQSPKAQKSSKPRI